MSFGSQQYVPCLRWKQGEYQALYRLSSKTQESIVPLIEIPEIGYDFESRMNSKSIDEHLYKFAKRVKDKWGGHCLVDMHLIESSQRMNSGQHPFVFVLEDLRLKGVLAIPVIGLKQAYDCQNEIEAIVATDMRGICIRISIEEAAKPDLAASLGTLIQQYNVEADECDFILDMGAPNFEPIDSFGKLLEKIIGKLPHLNEWRSFALIGTSFPQSMGGVKLGASIIPRNEWTLYKSLIRRLIVSGIRIPTFGDYVINHPDVLLLDMRLVKPSATVRYTIEDGWLILKGYNVRDYRYGQYRGLCQEIVASKYYSGKTFSEGDKYIHGCAQGTESTGQLTTWRWVGTNHHLEKVVQDVANLSVA
ncbi:MAG: beta family protein [Dehalococcoidia bacterium]